MSEKRSGKSELNACELWWISRLPKFLLLTATPHNETVIVPFEFTREPTLFERRLDEIDRWLDPGLLIIDEWDFVPSD